MLRVVYDGLEATAKLDVSSYDVVVLDRDLPGLHGDIVCRMITESEKPAMVLMLTAAGTPGDRVAGLSLGAKEFAVLEALMRAAPAVLSAEDLLEQVWDENADPFTKTVQVTMGRLRRKLGEPQVIETLPNLGYRIADRSVQRDTEG
jgi:DNA-binding response OmpR family regulator